MSPQACISNESGLYSFVAFCCFSVSHAVSAMYFKYCIDSDSQWSSGISICTLTFCSKEKKCKWVNGTKLPTEYVSRFDWQNVYVCGWSKIIVTDKTNFSQIIWKLLVSSIVRMVIDVSDGIFFLSHSHYCNNDNKDDDKWSVCGTKMILFKKKMKKTNIVVLCPWPHDTVFFECAWLVHLYNNYVLGSEKCNKNCLKMIPWICENSDHWPTQHLSCFHWSLWTGIVLTALLSVRQTFLKRKEKTSAFLVQSLLCKRTSN